MSGSGSGGAWDRFMGQYAEFRKVDWAALYPPPDETPKAPVPPPAEDDESSETSGG